MIRLSVYECIVMVHVVSYSLVLSSLEVRNINSDSNCRSPQIGEYKHFVVTIFKARESACQLE